MSDRRARLARLTPEQRALLAKRRNRDGGGPRAGQAGAGPHRPSAAQERFWFLQQLGTRLDEYHMSGLCRLHGPLDRRALEQAVARCVARHDSLRSRFPDRDGVPELVVEPELHLPLAEHAAPQVPDDGREAYLLERARQLHRRPFDLTRAPLLRLELVAFAADDHGLLVCQHHIVSDGASFGVLMDEFTRAYNALVTGREPELPDVPLRFVDHAHWQRQRLSGERGQRLLAAWTETLDGAPAAVDLPVDRPRPASPGHRGHALRARLDPALVAEARSLARRHGTTLFVVLLSAVVGWLQRLTGQDDLVVGTSSSQRDRLGTERLVGPFVNTLALRGRVDPARGFDALIASQAGVVRHAMDLAELPFERLVEALAPDRDPTRQPLVNVFCDMAAREAPTSWHGLRATPIPFVEETASFDLALWFTEEADGLAAVLQLSADLYDRSTPERWWRSWTTWLADALSRPAAPLDALAVLDDAARTEQLVTLQPPPFEYDRRRPVHQRIAAAAAIHAARPALVDDLATLTHGEVERRATALAQQLVGHGVGSDVPVAVCLPRCPEVPVALLAIWKAGGCYVPLDPEDPDARLAGLLDALAPAVLLARPVFAERGLAANRPLLTVDAWRHAPDDSALPDAVDPDDLAYVIHTSGSTGVPKGVMISHGALAHHVAWVAERFDLGPDDRLLMRTPLGFDASLWELVHPLVCGASLVVAPPDALLDPAALLACVADHGISVLQTVPSMLSLWLDEPALARCHALRHLICAGEVLTPELVDRVAELRARHGLGFRLHNLYGPSEATIDATLHSVDLTRRREPVVVPVGRPQGATRVHVLDARGRLLPRGATGEVAIGGDGLARGYLGRPELTAKRFVDGSDGTGRLYLTGDRGRWLPDGSLHVAGRVDDQVQLNGRRVELGEIEAALVGHPDVREAAAAVDGADGTPRRLVAYVVPRPGRTVDEPALTAFLRGHLPRALMPAVFVTLDALPLNASEKLDRRALPAPPVVAHTPGQAMAGARSPADPSDTALSETERMLVATAAELLGLERVGLHDDFFALGGHSLLAARLASRVAERCGRRLPLMPFFERPTLATLAEMLARDDAAADAAGDGNVASGVGADPIGRARAGDGEPRPVPRDGPLPANPAQERLWFLSRLRPEGREYHVTGALELVGVVDEAALLGALDDLRARHEVLRTHFAERDGELLQVIEPPAPWPVTPIDLSTLPAEEAAAAVERARASLDARPYDLERGPLVRAAWLDLGPERHVLLVGLHHVIADAATLDGLLGELGRAYASRRDGRPWAPPAPALQMADVAHWQRRRLDAARTAALVAWWRAELAGAPPGIDLPGERLGPADDERAAHLVERPLPDGLWPRLRRFAEERGRTPYAVLLAAFDVWLARLTGERDLVVATTVDQRDRVELAGVPGLLVNAVPVRVRLAADADEVPDFERLVAIAARGLAGALAHAELPFERLVDALVTTRDGRRPPLVNVSLDLLEALPLAELLPGVTTRLLPVSRGWAKLDLSVVVEHAGERAVARVECRRSLLTPESLARLWDAFEVLLDGLLGDPTQPVTRTPWLTPDERRRVLEASRGPRPAGPAAVDVPGLLARHADDHPALCDADDRRRLTHGQLRRAAARLAADLTAAGVRAGDRVALDLPRRLELVVALLAVWRVGAAWLPLDARDPPARRRQVLDDGRPTLLLVDGRGPVSAGATRAEEPGDALASGTHGADAPTPPAGLDLPVLDVAGVLDDAADDPAPPPDAPVDPQAPAYVLHTSGSTGRPKGVVVPHRALAHVLAAIADDLDLDADDVVLQRLPLSFDAALLELLAPLVAGARVVLVDDERARDPAAVARLIRRRGATMLQAVPGFLAAVLDEPDLVLDGVRRVGCGGEALPVALLRRLRDRLGPHVPVVNMYGPTEATIQASSHHCRIDEPLGMPIGRPLPGVVLRVLDGHGGLMPRGVVGELFVGGAGLSDGYLDRPAETVAAFVPDPYDDGLLYRTGDLGRLRADGTFEWAGRRDDQLKLGGRRVEPGGIEALLEGHAEVQLAAVLPAPGRGALVAHVVSGASGEALRTWLAERLPAASVPSVVTVQERLPLTATGKLDRAALAALPVATPAVSARHAARTSGDGRAADAHAGPGDDTTDRLAGLAGELLGRGPLDPDEDLFAAGFHSLLALRLVERMERDLALPVPVAAVFERPTARGLAGLRNGGPADSGTCVAALREDARLDEALRPGARRGRHPPRRVLLTGATGFLGAHLVQAWLERPDTTLVLPVRGADEDAARQRLAGVAARHGLGPWPAERLEVHAGDLTAARIGLSAPIWDGLADDIDLVLHCAAAVDFLRPYAALRAANVESTRQLLELAARAGAAFHLVSTLGVLAAAARAGSPRSDTAPLDEATPLDDPTAVEGGYEQSKWVAEQLVLAAGRRGLPVAVHRPGRLAGAARSGVWNTDDVASRLLAGALALGARPDVDGAFDLTPVDFAAAAIVALARDAPAPPGGALISHLLNPEPVPVAALFERVAARGWRCEPLPPPAWRARVAAALDADPGHVMARLLPLLPDDDADLAPDAGLEALGHAATRRRLADLGLRCPAPDAALLDAWLDTLAAAPALDAPPAPPDDRSGQPLPRSGPAPADSEALP